MMIKLYDNLNFKLLESWVTDAELLFQFSGTDFSFPLTERQIMDYQIEYPDRRFYLGYSADNLPTAFGEVIPQDSGYPRLGRILIGQPDLRGQGLGRKFIESLVEECRRLYNIDTVELFVWEKNYAAIRCYESVGFRLLVNKFNVLIHNGISYQIYKMVYRYSDNDIDGFNR